MPQKYNHTIEYKNPDARGVWSRKTTNTNELRRLLDKWLGTGPKVGEEFFAEVPCRNFGCTRIAFRLQSNEPPRPVLELRALC